MKELLVTLVFSLHFLAPAVAGGKTDLQKEGLLGPVQTVRIETAQFSNQSGQWVEEPRQLSATSSYDVKGHRIAEIGNIYTNKTLYAYNARGDPMETLSYDPDGSLVSKTVYTYDPQGRVTEVAHYKPDGSLGDKAVHTYDPQGKLTEAVCYDASGGFCGKTAYTYDDKGNLIEEEILGKLRSVHTYDAQGHRTATAHYDAHGPGLGIEKTVETYDAHGNIMELTTYYTQRAGEEEDREISPPNKFIYTYEWDAHGNWVKQTQTLCTAESGAPTCEPSSVAYRTITYYPETAVQ